MHIPEEFVTFSAFFHQDFDLMFPDGNGLIEDAINHTPPEQRTVIKEYLDDLLSGKYSETELQLMWKRTRAEISPFRGNEGSCTDFLTLIRSFFT